VAGIISDLNRYVPDDWRASGTLQRRAAQLKKMLGLTSVNYTETNHTLAVVDSTLEQAKAFQ
jgi:hypothetical protein